MSWRACSPIPGATQVIHNYADVPGAIPIPATLSLELGKVIGEQQGNITYRFVSDYPFKGRAPHELDQFRAARRSTALRGDPKQIVNEVSWNNFDGRVRLVAPVVMGAACVTCHNSHPDSPKKDWKVGDVRGIQEVIVDQPIAKNLFSFKWLLGYFGVMAALRPRRRRLAEPAIQAHRRHEQGARDRTTPSSPRCR